MAANALARSSAVHRSSCLAALLCAWPLAVAGQAGPPAAPARGCVAGEARFAIGQVYTADLADRAAQAAGARVVRKIERGGAYTMEFSPHRLNVEVDGAGIVRDLTCG